MPAISNFGAPFNPHSVSFLFLFNSKSCRTRNRQTLSTNLISWVGGLSPLIRLFADYYAVDFLAGGTAA